LVLSLIPIVLGLALSSFTEADYTLYGFACALASTGLFNLSNILTKKIIKDTGVQINHLLLLTDTITFIFLIPPWIYHGSENWNRLSEDPTILTKNAWAGFFSFLHALISMNLMDHFTALSYSVLNVFKRLVLIVGSVLYFGNIITPLNQVGIMTASSGVLYYSKVKIDQRG